MSDPLGPMKKYPHRTLKKRKPMKTILRCPDSLVMFGDTAGISWSDVPEEVRSMGGEYVADYVQRESERVLISLNRTYRMLKKERDQLFNLLVAGKIS